MKLIPFTPCVELSLQVSDRHFQHLTIWVATFSCKTSTLSFSLALYFHFSQDSQDSISNVEDEDVMLREVCQDESIMSHAHYSSLLHSSLALPLETSTEGSLYIAEIEELKRKRQQLSDAIIEI